MNKVFIKGISNHTINPAEFIGKIIFEKWDNGIYFNWELKTLRGEFLGMKGDFISINIIPQIRILLIMLFLMLLNQLKDTEYLVKKFLK